MPNTPQKLLSYLYPVTIEERKGTVTPYLEVCLYKGKYILNSANANYSFDGLHQVMDRFFSQVKLGNFAFENILLLGMGAGSVIELIRNKYEMLAPITAIEKDAVVIELAEKYFDIHSYKHLRIVNEDAFDFVNQTNEQFDLIISDVFIDNTVPTKCQSEEYYKCLRKIVSPQGLIGCNLMVNQKDQTELAKLKAEFESVFRNSKTMRFIAQGEENLILYYNPK
jgi:spermidine synthase